MVAMINMKTMTTILILRKTISWTMMVATMTSMLMIVNLQTCNGSQCHDDAEFASKGNRWLRPVDCLLQGKFVEK